ncbi:MAG TPA: 2-amino-4-hydroxy-6-hydroxymethyldihydropteridine diphosphokinase [Luteimonas sp.]|jgi:2-amino-4-hydroxy-6-hydroxymethyldihydropteridine diphosphokinase|nr:2-amino-4-hydroxy-6-hydroxymethyldihydropteridine diphosphokinase [Luteimonas sp.]
MTRAGEAVVAAVGLGANLGDAAATLREAAQALERLPGTRLLRASPLYRTPAWGKTDQPDFVNAAALVETTLAARALLDALLGLERRFGRRREAGEQWGPRILDLDLLLYGEAVIDEPGLRVPHPHLHERAFALLPLARIAPAMAVPGRGRVDALLAGVDASGCVEAVTPAGA